MTDKSDFERAREADRADYQRALDAEWPDYERALIDSRWPEACAAIRADYEKAGRAWDEDEVLKNWLEGQRDDFEKSRLDEWKEETEAEMEADSQELDELLDGQELDRMLTDLEMALEGITAAKSTADILTLGKAHDELSDIEKMLTRLLGELTPAD